MKFDVAVIGAGIQGVGVAQAVAAAGYSVVVLEKNAPASGTSCKSSKLIHGGLRYLESGQFKLVYECLHERQILLKNAPDLVQLKPFFIPVYRETSRPTWKINIGLNLYHALSGFDASGRFRKLQKSEWKELDGLTTENLVGVYQYWDAQTNDALLTQAVLRSAKKLGAELICPARFLNCEKNPEGWTLRYQQGETTQNLQAQVIVNAAGPWVNEVLGKISPQLVEHKIDLVQGTHIVVPEKTSLGIYYIEAPRDKRVIFVMPWGEQTMIGTTEKNFSGNPDDVCASDEEINYLLETVSHYFPQFATYQKDTITKSFAGLRVLPGGGNKAFAKARDTVIYENAELAPGIVTLFGGKLTAYRATAEQAMQKILRHLPERRAVADTKELMLS